jgi:uncharacterized protein (DUF1697 family)
MAIVVSVLRGVNVGGHNKVKMEALRALYESLKLRSPVTYIQSGNVVFGTGRKDLGRLAAEIRETIGDAFGFRPDVFLRTAAEMRRIVAENPFTGRADVAPNRLVVMFLAGGPGPEALARLAGVNRGPEELRATGREIYIHFPHGIAAGKLSLPAVEQALRQSYTGRNWNTVTKLLAMAEAMEAVTD